MNKDGGLTKRSRERDTAATVLSTISMVVGTIALPIALIPYLGAVAICGAMPAALCSAIALYLAFRARRVVGFAATALVISILGVAVAEYQIVSVDRIVKRVANGVDKFTGEMMKNGSDNPPLSSPRTTSAVKPIVMKSGKR